MKEEELGLAEANELKEAELNEKLVTTMTELRKIDELAAIERSDELDSREEAEYPVRDEEKLDGARLGEKENRASELEEHDETRL